MKILNSIFAKLVFATALSVSATSFAQNTSANQSTTEKSTAAKPNEAKIEMTGEVTKGLMVEGRAAEEVFINTSQGRFRFTAEIADTPEKSQRGLMFRETMPHDHGMLFDFGEEREVLMWMKNTPLSLDMVFLSPKGEVVSIARATTPYSQEIISSKKLASAVLEINAGVSKLLGLKAGDTLQHRFFGPNSMGETKEKAN